MLVELIDVSLVLRPFHHWCERVQACSSLHYHTNAIVASRVQRER